MTTDAEVFDALKYHFIEVDGNGTRRYYNAEGQYHRADGPAVEWRDGSTEWWVNGKLHREDGPAVFMLGHGKEWFRNGMRHRDNGPAVEYSNGGGRIWFMNGQKHRLDGPAVEYPNGCRLWYLYGVEYEAQEFHDKLTQYGFAK